MKESRAGNGPVIVTAYMNTPQSSYHISVMPEEICTYLALKPQGVYVDATFGGGGHTKAILEAEPTCTVIGIDWDAHAFELNASDIEENYGDRFIPMAGSFSHIHRILKKLAIEKVDGIIADFGTSQYQIKNLPGFSFTVPTPLDMRMSPGHQKITAYDVVNRANEDELAQIFFDYGEEPASRKIARLMVEQRKLKPIATTTDLTQIILKIVKPYSRSIHPATKVFQALRIFVNDELNNIRALLSASLTILNPGGRIVCISFHSLEDRIVKQFFKAHADELLILTKKVVLSSPLELERNPSSRSAKLRAAQKT